MKVEVHDTYVKKKDGRIMHFDILVPEGCQIQMVHAFGRDYLKAKGQEGQALTARECQFCHIEQARPEVQADIARQGYHIIEMEGC